jgi:glucose-1-phosphate cytidylyltransferase
MVEIGGKPILWHIMKGYSSQGFNDFVILTGYMGYYIKEYFANYFLHNSDITFDLGNNNMEVHYSNTESWKVTILDTGVNTMTGGRIKRAQRFINNEPFMLTYGDGVSDIDIHELLAFHKQHGKILTVTAVQPEGRFGSMEITDNNQVHSFKEKPKGDSKWINGGFFVCEPSIMDYIDNDETVFERKPMESLAEKGEIFSYRHNSFWKCMDTLSDKQTLNKLWDTGMAKWKIW